MAEEFKMGALGLLESYLEFNSLRPKRRNWTESRLAHDQYGLRRYRRLVALFKAFGVRCRPASFHKGEWLDAGSPNYASLVTRIHESVSGTLPTWINRPDYHRDSLCFMFKQLLMYRIDLHPVLDATSGVLEASGAYLYTLDKLGEMNHVIYTHLGPINDLLEELISPTHARFSIAELVRDYGYPPIDPSEEDPA